MSLSVEQLEFWLLILMRIASFVFTAPFFSYNTIPMRVKLAISILLALVVIPNIPNPNLEYVGVIGYGALVIKESVIGLLMGFVCSLCMYIITFAGQMIDMDMGLSMATMFDPLTRVNASISANMYMYIIMLFMLVGNLHYYFISAICDSFKYFNVGQASFEGNFVSIAGQFMTNYFIVGFRIVLPMFAAMLLVNIVLGVLTRAAPQMNMFVVGIQIKVMFGIVIILLTIPALPRITEFIFESMKELETLVLRAFTPT